MRKTTMQQKMRGTPMPLMQTPSQPVPGTRSASGERILADTYKNSGIALDSRSEKQAMDPEHRGIYANTMGVPQIVSDAAPAYDDAFNDHPVNEFPPSEPHMAYATVSQNDDIEHLSHDDSSFSAAPALAIEPESLEQTCANTLKLKHHVHCEQCDAQLAARQRRDGEWNCSILFAVTLVIFCFFAVLLGAFITYTR
ncbi:hypothetical protein NX059_005017 [Plenodomus lindquistii]|nr:hypothetical protein NX059_005017 [Plenodomus lindquistii]